MSKYRSLYLVSVFLSVETVGLSLFTKRILLYIKLDLGKTSAAVAAGDDSDTLYLILALIVQITQN